MASFFVWLSAILGLGLAVVGFFSIKILMVVGIFWFLLAVGMSLFSKEEKDSVESIVEKIKSGMGPESVHVGSVEELTKGLSESIAREGSAGHEEREKVSVFHGISGLQRGGGDEFTKLKNIINDGVLFPGGAEAAEGELDKFFSAIFEHASKHGIMSGKLNIDGYIEKNIGDSTLTGNPSVGKYLDDDKFRKAIGDLYADIDIDNMKRTRANWVSTDESDTSSSYGEGVYVEFGVPKEDLIAAGGATSAMVPKPISIKDAKRIVLASKYKNNIGEIQGLLNKKGFGSVKVEVKE